MFDLPELKELGVLSGVVDNELAQCHFGAVTSKPTLVEGNSTLGVQGRTVCKHPWAGDACRGPACDGGHRAHLWRSGS